MVGMCCVEGPMTSIPGEVVVGQPRKQVRALVTYLYSGTSKGSLLKSEWGKQVRALVTYLFPPSGRLATERCPTAPQTWRCRQTYCDKYVSAHFVASMYLKTLPQLCF